MLYLGKNITAVSEILQPITEEQLVGYIVAPSEAFKVQIEQLRIIRTIDTKRYAALKRSLPYFVGSTFNPALRRTENFAYCSYFILDIDHISEKGLERDQLRQSFLSDMRIRLCFVSPSQDGFKLLFRLRDKCYDSGIFTLFYRVFASHFARQYHLEQVVDSKTCDVTRACFLSYDSAAHYNPLAEDIDLNTFVNMSDASSLFDQKRAVDQNIAPTNTTRESADKDPDSDAIRKIKEVLGLYRTKKEQPVVYVPEQLNAIMDGLRTFLETVDVVVTDIRDIHYGKKIKVSLGSKCAECNLFYGKRGFTAVQSPRTGTDKELNAMLQELIYAFLSIS